MQSIHHRRYPVVNESFLIQNGKIRRVEMVGPAVTYHLNSGWPEGLSGN